MIMFYADPTVNVNPETQIRYGVAQGNNHPYLLDHIMQNGNDLAYDYFVSEIKSSLRMLDNESNEADIKAVLDDIYGHDLESFIPEILDILTAPSNVISIDGAIEDYPLQDELWDLISDDVEYESDSDSMSYELDEDGCKYAVSSLGGAALIWVYQSTNIVYVESLCSPCVPNAGDLDSGLTDEDNGYQCYGIPTEWEQDND
jgi:hypothetical protein